MLAPMTGDGDAGSNEYVVLIVRGWTKERMAERMEQALSRYPREDIVSINVFADQAFGLLWRRNAAVITLRPSG
jgi:hypothetical protein